MRYYTLDGEKVTREEICAAYAHGRAVLVHGHRLGGGVATSLALNGRHFDTRGACSSIWDEVWTSRPETLEAALRAAAA